jgi:hypothetical protein
MKYYIDTYNDTLGEWERLEITEIEALDEIGKYYTNANELIKIPCYYRTLWGGVEVVEG